MFTFFKTELSNPKILERMEVSDILNVMWNQIINILKILKIKGTVQLIFCVSPGILK